MNYHIAMFIIATIVIAGVTIFIIKPDFAGVLDVIIPSLNYSQPDNGGVYSMKDQIFIPLVVCL